MDVAYLYTKDDPLRWSYETYSYYFGLKYGIGALSLILLSPVARRYHVQEALTCCVGLVSKSAGLVLHGLATTTVVMFCVPFVSMFNTFCLPSIRSLLSKQVEPNELGKNRTRCTTLADAITYSVSRCREVVRVRRLH